MKRVLFTSLILFATAIQWAPAHANGQIYIDPTTGCFVTLKGDKISVVVKGPAPIKPGTEYVEADRSCYKPVLKMGQLDHSLNVASAEQINKAASGSPFEADRDGSGANIAIF